jgi:hypothetical protein
MSSLAPRSRRSHHVAAFSQTPEPETPTSSTGSAMPLLPRTTEAVVRPNMRVHRDKQDSKAVDAKLA